ncbi:hypothetical protein PoB_004522100 [Plakobranchus ocellatus]|uniref:Uncharacterized protein n=1 Tax=Plakobranchus ocellatus TaxID=259542 RepID=A0AAV4B5Q0_9GAST|nr:hypothetical protein PoB_004522100 [Plakobranchus ocellatus]
MKAVAVISVLALMAYTASATPCTDICNGQCVLEKQACDFTGLLGDLCDTQYGLCTQTCTAACSCADTCAAQCGGEYATCKADADVLNIFSCGLNLSICASTCQAQCNFNLFAGIVNSLSGSGAAML